MRAIVSVAVTLACFQSVAARGGEDAEHYATRARYWLETGDYDKAIEDYNHALLLDPNNAAAYLGRSSAWGGKREYDKAIEDCNAALRINPTLATAYHSRGIAWQQKHEYNKAIEDYNEALRLDPKNADACCSRASAWGEKREYGKVLDDCNAALRIRPSFALAYYIRGNAWREKGDYARATEDYKEAIRLAPSDAYTYNGLAWVQATCPDERYRDGKEAVANVNRIIDLGPPEQWYYHGTFAAAYAESGDFTKAIESQTKAIELAAKDVSARDSDKEELGVCLELYKQGKPYREEPKPKP